MSKYRFYLSYNTEVSLRVTVKKNREGYFKAECTHPLNKEGSVSGISLADSWFFFAKQHAIDSVTYTIIEETIIGLLTEISKTFYPAIHPFIADEESAAIVFTEHVYTAFALGALPDPNLRVDVVDTVNRKV